MELARQHMGPFYLGSASFLALVIPTVGFSPALPLHSADPEMFIQWLQLILFKVGLNITTVLGDKLLIFFFLFSFFTLNLGIVMQA